jgi:hypothetical protein
MTSQCPPSSRAYPPAGAHLQNARHLCRQYCLVTCILQALLLCVPSRNLRLHPESLNKSKTPKDAGPPSCIPRTMACCSLAFACVRIGWSTRTGPPHRGSLLNTAGPVPPGAPTAALLQDAAPLIEFPRTGTCGHICVLSLVEIRFCREVPTPRTTAM